MIHYWLHIAGGTELTQHGPFDSKAAAFAWREPYHDDGEQPASEPVPLGPWDDYGADTWVFCTIHPDGTFEAET